MCPVRLAKKRIADAFVGWVNLEFTVCKTDNSRSKQACRTQHVLRLRVVHKPLHPGPGPSIVSMHACHVYKEIYAPFLYGWIS